MKNTIIVFDFETTSADPHSELCDPVEIGAVTVHSKNLEIIRGSEFFITVRPDDIEDEDYYEKHKGTIDWHLSLPHHKGKSPEDLINEWKLGTPEKEAMKMFAVYVNQYNYMNKAISAPIAAGANIKRFDMVIYERLCAKHKIKPFFFKRDQVDILDLCFYWFAFNIDPPKSHKMDDLRPFFGMGMNNAHNALQDVHQEAEIVCNFLRLHKSYGSQIQFRGMIGEK